MSEQHNFIYKTARRACHLIPYALHMIKNRKLLKTSLPDIANMRNMYTGQRCFVIGNGPSLTPQDVSRLKNDITFGSNRIYKMFDKTDWRPTYYCAQDTEVIKQDVDVINKIKSRKLIGIVGSVKYPKIDNALFIKLILKEFYPQLPLFSDNAVDGVYEGLTVTYFSLQMAIYMGFKEIYLLGVDHCFPKMIDENGQYVETDMKNAHFSPDDKVYGNGTISIHKTTLAYKKAKEYADAHGIKIYNATRGGRLEVFERVNFDDLFNEESEK